MRDYSERSPKLDYSPAQRSLFSLKKRRQLYPMMLRLRPLALSMTCMVLIGLMALLYLSQVGHGLALNQQIQNARNEQANLQRENQDLLEKYAKQTSPAALAEAAKQLGLVPVDQENVQIISIPGIVPIPQKQP